MSTDSSTPALSSSGKTVQRLLVVDDNADAAETLCMLLEELEHEVRTATSGRQALAVAAEFCPDIVFLDIGLPDIDGLEVARLLRAQPSGPMMVLVAVTGWGQDKDKEETREAGFDHHFVKPLDPVQLEQFLATKPQRSDRKAR